MVTAPYFHDGSFQTLWDVVDHYNKGDGLEDPWLDEDIQPLALRVREIDDLVAFLASLTNPQYKEAGDKEYARQLALSKISRPQRDTKRAFGAEAASTKAAPALSVVRRYPGILLPHATSRRGSAAFARLAGLTCVGRRGHWLVPFFGTQRQLCG